MQMQRAYERKNRRGVIWIYSGFSDLCIDGRLFYDFFVVSPPCLFAFYSSVYFPWLWTSSADKFVVLLFSLAVSLMGDGIPIQAIENARVNPLPTESDVFDFSYIPSLSCFVQPRMRVQKKSSIVLNMCFRWGGTAMLLFSFSVLTVTFRWIQWRRYGADVNDDTLSPLMKIKWVMVQNAEILFECARL